MLAPLKIIASPVPATEAGSDVEEIAGAGVPVLALNQDASRYFDYHHTADDTLEIVDPVQLRQNVAAWAATLVHPGRQQRDLPGEEMTRPPIPAPPYEGGCLCGAMRYRLNDRPQTMGACHCDACKKMSGGTNLLVITAPREAFTTSRARCSAIAAPPSPVVRAMWCAAPPAAPGCGTSRRPFPS